MTPAGNRAAGSRIDRTPPWRHSGYRFPPEVIQHAIWLYIRFTLSFRDVEDLLTERGILVSYETVRRWVNHFGPMVAADPNPIRPLGVDGPDGIDENEVIADLKQRRPSVESISRIGMDTSKHIFQLHGVNVAEQLVLRKKLRRRDMMAFFERLAPTVIAIEACGASHH